MDAVCVIGAGGAGLATAQALRARDVPFVVYEAGSGIGGNWRYENDSGLCSAYASLTTNVSRQRTSYRCFPLRRGPLYLHHTRMLAYLEAFADRFGLREHIRLSSPVTSVRPVADGGWEVRVADGAPSITTMSPVHTAKPSSVTLSPRGTWVLSTPSGGRRDAVPGATWRWRGFTPCAAD